MRGLVTGMATVVLAVSMAGCGQSKATSSSEAIRHAQTLKTPEQQADYLVGQARAFLHSKEYQEAIQTAQYVLAQIDQHSRDAQELLQKAKSQLTADAKALADDAHKSVNDAKKQLGF